MKNLILTTIAILLSGIFLNIQAQINLDVEGRAIIRDGTPRLDLYDTDQGRSETYLFSSNGTLFVHSRFGDINFRADDNGGFDSRLYIDATDGHVGIGTGIPSSKLHVVDGGEASLTQHGYLLLGDVSSSNLVLDRNEMQARSNGSAASLFIQPAGGSLFMDGNTFTMNSNNNRIGMGTSSPAVKLHIVGGTDVNASNGGYLQLGSSNSLNMGIDDNELQARSNGAASTLSLQRDGGDLMLCAQENGQVGIGVSSVSGLPNSDYLLAVDGKIIAEEVRVEMSGAWPDYVFEADYNLLSIDEYAESIKKNGHLPGIPSAKEVKDEGQHVGDIQRKMLEKMEEMSLYIIQLNEQNKALAKEIEKLQDN